MNSLILAISDSHTHNMPYLLFNYERTQRGVPLLKDADLHAFAAHLKGRLYKMALINTCWWMHAVSAQILVLRCSLIVMYLVTGVCSECLMTLEWPCFKWLLLMPLGSRYKTQPVPMHLNTRDGAARASVLVVFFMVCGSMNCLPV